MKKLLLRYFNKKSVTLKCHQELTTRIDEGFQLKQQQSDTTKPSCCIDFLHKLPVELSCVVLSFCDEKTILECTHVSKYWYLLCKDNHVWRALYLHHHGMVYPPSYAAINYKQLYQRKLELVRRWRKGDNVHMQTVLGHADSIYCVQFDSEKIVTGSRDRTIKFWYGGYCFKTLKGHHASVLCLQYDDEILVSGSSDHTLLVWSMKTFQVVHCLRGHQSGVLDVCFDKVKIVSCSKDATIRVWQRETGALLQTLMGHRGPVNAIQFHENRLVSASGDTLIKLWDMETGHCLRDFAGHTHGLACIRFDGKKIVSGSNDKKIKVWNAGKNTCLVPSYIITLFFRYG